MKKIITSLVLFIAIAFSVDSYAQNPHPFELGFNAGASWLKSDVKMKKLGGGWGVTFGQTYCMNQTSPLLWGWRFRYLNANTFGQGFEKSFGIANNTVLNGSADSLLNYNSAPGYVYQNYKTHLDELSLEILLGANKIRERTNLYPYIFAGVGLTKAVTKTNQLDDENHRYNYLMIDSTGTAGKSEIVSQLNDMYDGSYESLAEGSRSAKWKFMPSVGVGLGFEVIKGFSIGLEHKVTWGLNDVLDGQKWSNTNTSTGNNDLYHYSSVWIKFSFGRGSKTTNNTTTTTTTPPDVNTYTNTTAAAPAITFSNPAYPGTTVTQAGMTVSGKISNINSTSDMTITVNGNAVTGFTYNSGTGIFNYPMTLQSGATTIVVSAVNATGNANETTSVIYNPVAEAPQLPLINILEPNHSPAAVNYNSAPIKADIRNIDSQSQIQLMFNGVATNGFSYNAATHEFTFMAMNLMRGANTIMISATNTGGTNSKSVTVIYEPVTQAPPVIIPPGPVVTITSPGMNPYTTNVNPLSFTATVLNVESRNAITLYVNGFPNSGFTYDMISKVLHFPMNLSNGANTIKVDAVNGTGSDSKTQTVIYSQPVAEPGPVVTITNPGTNPSSTTMNSTSVNATVLNVSSLSQIAVTLNGVGIPAGLLNFNPAVHQLMFNVNLVAGANVVAISANNSGGSDSKTTTIMHSKQVTVRPPAVTIINPAANPSNTTVNTATINAKIINVAGPSEISVTVNGIATSAFSYTLASRQLTLNTNLIAGANVIVISATNTGGSDSKTATIIYTAPAAVPAPVVTITNPASSPFSTTVNTATIKAMVTNVAGSSEISVMVNGTATPGFTYNTSSHQFMLNTNLIVGANTIVISARNAGGTDSKTQTIIYTQPEVVPAPVISYINPPTNTISVSAATFALTAKVINVSDASQVSVKFNGVATSAFNYELSTKNLTFDANLTEGSNKVVIMATNSAGTDIKTIMITYTKPVIPRPTRLPSDTVTTATPGTPAPGTVPLKRPGNDQGSITLITPSGNSVTTTDAVYSVQAKLEGAIATGTIAVKINGVDFTGYTFNVKTKSLTIPATLNNGNNTVVIQVTNGSGTKTETIAITKQ